MLFPFNLFSPEKQKQQQIQVYLASLSFIAKTAILGLKQAKIDKERADFPHYLQFQVREC
jgi:hypothetical protein